MKKCLLLLVMFTCISAFSQSINDYQYVKVPISFDFLKGNDKFHLNTTTKMLLQKYGFKAYLPNDSIPTEIANNNCSQLYANLEVDKSFIQTKVKVVLRDCKDKVVYETDYGISREKEFDKAYNEAIRNTSKSFEKLNYKYHGKNSAVEVSALPESPAKDVNTILVNNPDIFFFAQPIVNGFQIVDNEPRVIMRLFNTSQKNVFIGIREDTHGVVIFKNNQWFFEYYEKGKFVSEPLKIRF